MDRHQALRILRTVSNERIKMGSTFRRGIDWVLERKSGSPEIKYGIKETARHHLISATYDLLDYYREAFGWIRANPSIPEVIEATDFFYIHPDAEPTLGNNIANVEKNLPYFTRRLLDFSEKGIRRTVFIRGKKGTGKTFFINYYLNHFNSMLKQEKIVWYRVDASKVYDYDMSLYHYFCIQVTYVSFKYSESCLYVADILEISHNFLDWLEKTPDINANYVLDLIDKFKLLLSKPRSHRSLLNIDDKFGKGEIHEMADIILRYLVDRGVRFLFIFDGIDNIDYYHGKQRYATLLNDLKKLFNITVEKAGPYGGKVLVTLRDESLEYILDSAQSYGDLETFVVKNIGIDDICTTKTAKVISAAVRYCRTKKASARQVIDDDEYLREIHVSSGKFDEWLSTFGERFPATLLEEFKEKKIPDINDTADLLSSVYNGNIRAFINNMLHSYEYKLLFELKKAYLTNRDYIIPEGMFLDGRLLIDSSFHGHEDRGFLNILFYENDTQSSTWRGLCGYRILQYLEASSMRESDELYTVMAAMGYEDEVIRQFVERFVDHGLIEPKRIEDSTYAYLITRKGRFFARYPFQNVDYLYYMALDVPLSEWVFDDSRVFQMHEKFWENYPECCVKTAMTLIRHIKTQLAREDELIRKSQQRGKLEVFLGQHPNFDTVFREMLRIASATDKESLIMDLKGLLL